MGQMAPGRAFFLLPRAPLVVAQTKGFAKIHLQVRGKRDKVRYVPLHAMAQRLQPGAAAQRAAGRQSPRLPCPLLDDVSQSGVKASASS